MIITFSTTEFRVTGEEIFWFNVRIPGYTYTTFDVGFDKDGNWVSASKEVFHLDPSLKEWIISETAKMVPSVANLK